MPTQVTPQLKYTHNKDKPRQCPNYYTIITRTNTHPGYTLNKVHSLLEQTRRHVTPYARTLITGTNSHPLVIPKVHSLLGQTPTHR